MGSIDKTTPVVNASSVHCNPHFNSAPVKLATSAALLPRPVLDALEEGSGAKGCMLESPFLPRGIPAARN